MKPCLKFFLVVALLGVLAGRVSAQGARKDDVVLRATAGIAGANVAVCQPLATTAASVSSATGLATLTMSSNPVTAGYVVGMPIVVNAFSGGDVYFNGGSIVANQIVNGFTVAAVNATTIIYLLAHATASASSNGAVLQEGNTITSCAALAALYTDSTLGAIAANPFTSDGMGNYGFWAAPGQYDVQIYGPSIAATIRALSLSCVPPDSAGCTVAKGATALGTATIASGACAAAVTVAATGVLTTDNIVADFNADPTSTAGYSPGASGILTIIKYPTTGNVNFKVCNNTTGGITPGAVTLNWRVLR